MIIEVYWIYVSGLRFTDVTTIVYTIYILIQSMIRVEDVSSVISVDVFRSVDGRVSLKNCYASDPDNDCYVTLHDCCASGTNND